MPVPQRKNRTLAFLSSGLSSLRISTQRDKPSRSTEIVTPAQTASLVQHGSPTRHYMGLEVTLDGKNIGVVRTLAAHELGTLPVSANQAPQLNLGRLTTDDGKEQVVVLKALQLSTDPAKSGKEDRIWRRFSHPNILPLVGECFMTYRMTPGERQHYILSPYMKHGSLLDFMVNQPDLCDDARLLQFLLDVLAGMQYVHQLGYAHGDLKIDNILVNDDLVAVVCDFGLSTELVQSKDHLPTTDYVRSLGHKRYHSAEILQVGLVVLDGSWLVRKSVNAAGEPQTKLNGGRPRKSAAADMWAFGMIILHLYSGEWPWQEVEADGDIIAYIKAGLRPRFPGEHSARKITFRIWQHCWDCWELLPRHRPTAEEMIRKLSSSPSTMVASELSHSELVDFVRLEVVSLADEVAVNVTRKDVTTTENATTFWSVWYPPETQSGTPVLLKRYDDATLSPDGWSETLLHEIFYCKQLRHHSLLTIIGVCMIDDLWHAVFPFMDPRARSYRRYIENLDEDPSLDPLLNNATRLKMLLDICDALVFLHSQTPIFAHGAVCMNNVYIRTQNFRKPDELTIDACLDNFGHVTVGDKAAAVGDLRNLGELVRKALTGRCHLLDDNLPLLSNDGVSRILHLCTTCDETDVPEVILNVRAEVALLVDSALAGEL